MPTQKRVLSQPGYRSGTGNVDVVVVKVGTEGVLSRRTTTSCSCLSLPRRTGVACCGGAVAKARKTDGTRDRVGMA